MTTGTYLSVVGIPAHRMRQPALLLEIMIAPPFEFAQRVLVEERPVGAAGGDFPCRRFGAVLAEFKRMRLGRLGPCATDAHVAFRLVLVCKQGRAAGRNVFLQEYRPDRFCRAPAPGGSGIGRNFRMFFRSTAHAQFLSAALDCAFWAPPPYRSEQSTDARVPEPARCSSSLRVVRSHTPGIGSSLEPPISTCVANALGAALI